LRLLADTASGSGAALMMHNPKMGEQTIAIHSGIDAEAVREYYAGGNLVVLPVI
jgi:hypothetical protein